MININDFIYTIDGESYDSILRPLIFEKDLYFREIPLVMAVELLNLGVDNIHENIASTISDRIFTPILYTEMKDFIPFILGHKEYRIENTLVVKDLVTGKDYRFSEEFTELFIKEGLDNVATNLYIMCMKVIDLLVDGEIVEETYGVKIPTVDIKYIDNKRYFARNEYVSIMNLVDKLTAMEIYNTTISYMSAYIFALLNQEGKIKVKINSEATYTLSWYGTYKESQE